MENLFGNLKKIFKKKSFVWKSPNKSFYSKDIWERAYEMYKPYVEKGVTLYGEIVGEGIQGPDFTYGFDYQIFIYRITTTNVDGQVYEMSWEEVQRYCEKYGLTPVETYFKGKMSEVVGGFGTNEDLLATLQRAYLNKSYPDCQIDEGICIRVRNTNQIYKLKSPNFISKESAELEKGIEHES